MNGELVLDGNEVEHRVKDPRSNEVKPRVTDPRVNEVNPREKARRVYSFARRGSSLSLMLKERPGED